MVEEFARLFAAAPFKNCNLAGGNLAICSVQAAAPGLHFPVGMKEPSDARKRTLALQDRALRFSAAVNSACPSGFRDIPSSAVWGQLVRAADSASNNLLEADDATSTADFVHKMKTALREVKEARQSLAKIRLSSLAHVEKVGGLEQEADELAAIFATIVLNVVRRLEREEAARRHQRTHRS